ncbi:MAG: type III glutamate--ammonia ligase [Gammaproteobacteria bacterium]|jgi:glutamate---methylamine ligase|nr:type III glutamate--ammonia ligase [Gammaproteobacteria bacterium]
MKVDLAQVAKQKGIKYFLISFVDLFGVLRSKLVPARAIAGMQKDGAGFAGFAAWLDMTPAHPDLFAIPDPDSLIQLPWKPEVAWLASDLWMDGKEVEASPRVALKRQLAKLEKSGYRMKTGVECEYFLLTPQGNELSDPLDIQAKPCYDQSALMRRYDVVSEICDAMLELGWNPYQNDHEDANGQFEMNWDYDDCLLTADRHVFFKYMTKQIAENHGYRATFMPKPFANLTGNGCHSHVSLWDKTGKKNLFLNKKDDLGLSKLAYDFLGGIMHSATSLCALFNPTVNSYKRINAPRTTSGATWSPNTVTYSGNNRTHMIRVPDDGRFELRLMDGSANPYLMQAGVAAAGVDGIKNKRDPGEPLHIDMYEQGHMVKSAKRLPTNLLDALRLFEKNKILREQLGSELIDSYTKLKTVEWNDYASHLSEWERITTLDC